ncbi:MAG: hypothetical protein QME68_07405, partial [Elusimicrobiota bacterium]|nr:hypothetical protein [Elusimicrobiota bacterium]
TDKKQIIPDGDSGDYFFFSPDGTKIVFTGNLTSWGSVDGIYTAPVDLSTYTLVFSSPSLDITEILDWKSNTILFRAGSAIYRIDSDGSGFALITDGYFGSGKLSPDGTKVAYISQDGNCYIINTDGTGKVKLTDYKYTYFEWSSDSKKIAYINVPRASRDGFTLGKIYISNADGTNSYNLNPAIQFLPLPEQLFFVSGNKIVYSADLDTWSGDYDPLLGIPTDIAIPKEKGELKVVIPDGGGEKSTINPDLGKPVSIGFKGTSAGTFTLRIFTQFGEKIHEETKVTTTAEGWFDWLPKDLASGVYLVHVEGPGVKIFKKIAILR